MPSGGSSAPSGVFPTSTGFISLAIVNDAMFVSLCDALEQVGWKSDARFANMASRLAHATVLNTATADGLRRQPSAWWVARLQHHGVLHAEVLDHAQLVDHPQSRHQGVFGMLAQPGVGTLPFPRHPGVDPHAEIAPAPGVGADNEAVLAEAGFSDAEIAALRAAGALVD